MTVPLPLVASLVKVRAFLFRHLILLRIYYSMCVRAHKHFVNSQSLQTVYTAKHSVKSTTIVVRAEIARKEVEIMKYEIEITKTYTIEANSVDEAFDKLNEMLDGKCEISVATLDKSQA